MVHVPLMFLSEWREFPSAPCLSGKKLDDSSCLDVVEIARVALHASFQPLQQEKTCSSAHEQTHLSNDTTYSALRQWEVGRAKDLSAQHVLFMIMMLVTVVMMMTILTVIIIIIRTVGS